jgi:nanoRNase/pAp phosphatase (c-di-AMP/oligoRNAs hydrolase)
MRTDKRQIFDLIAKSNSILITLPKNENGDKIASALALYMYLAKMGKYVEIIQEDFIERGDISFLPSLREIKTEAKELQKFIVSLDLASAKIDEVKYKIEEDKLNFIITPKNGFFTHSDISSEAGDFKYDLIITIGAQELESLGSFYDKNTEFFFKTPIVNIDQESSNEEYGQINYIDLTAVANAEMIYALFEADEFRHLDEDISTCLLAGMIAKTRSFKAPFITPLALERAAMLISRGARREEIMNSFYRSRSISTLKLWGRALARLSGSLGNSLVWSALSSADFLKTGALESELPEVIDELVSNIPEAKVIVLLYESAASGPEPLTKAIICAMNNIDALFLAKDFNPRGGKRLASFELKEPLSSTSAKVISTLEEKLKNIQQKL